MEMKLNVKTIRHKDVRGKVLMYIQIGDGDDAILINVGTKTLDAVEDHITNVWKRALEETENHIIEETTKEGQSHEMED